MVALGAVHSAMQTPETEASLAFPGGIAALPSAAPAIPSQIDQNIPAIIGTGQPGIVTVFCWGSLLPVSAGSCPDPDGSGGGLGTISFKLTQLYPKPQLYPTSGEAVPMLTFDVTGTDTLVVTDNMGGDLDSAVGVVTVRVNAPAATQGGTKGVNEIDLVTGTDETGDAHSVQMVVVDTMMAFGPTGPLGTAAQEQPLLVSYHCDTIGRAPLVEGSPSWLVDPDSDGSQGLDDMYDGLFANKYGAYGPGAGYGSNTLEGDRDLPDVWCGGDTPNNLVDDYVSFQTDLGLFSVDPVAWTLKVGALKAADNNVFLPPIVDVACDQGKSVNIFDVDALYFWSQWLLAVGSFPLAPEDEPTVRGGCDVDGWRNGVVTMMLLGNGEVGTATITGQQGGGVSPPRTVYATFVGEPALSLYLVSPTTPIGVEGGEFTAVVLDSDFRPIGNETFSCSLDPKESGFIIWPQTATTKPVSDPALPGMVIIKILPTRKAVAAGGTLTLTCRLTRDPSVVAVGVAALSGFQSESLDLVVGCNPLASTWPDATPVDTLANAIAPPEALDGIWAFDANSGTWKGFSPAAPEASDLASVNELDAIFVCMNAVGTVSRPVI
jgi:hypothetical protein